MHPVLFEWRISSLPIIGSAGPITIYTYGVLLAAAYLGGLQLAMMRGRKRGLDQTRVLDLGIYIIISALIGAKLLLLVTDFRSFADNPRALLDLLRSGGVFYGGLIVAVIVALWYIRRIGLPLWTTCDVFAPGIALGHVVGRFGCFFAGCCYGKPTTVPWAITFTSPAAAANVGTPLNIPLHPTQLYEAFGELAIFATLLILRPRVRRHPGALLVTYLGLYALLRFVVEMFRGDVIRGLVVAMQTPRLAGWLHLPPREPIFFSVGQLGSLLVLALCGVVLARMRRASGTRGAKTRSTDSE